MNFWARLHQKPHHCELSSFGTAFAILALIISAYIYFFMSMQFANNMIYLFGLSTLAGLFGIAFYRYSMHKWPFNKI